MTQSGRHFKKIRNKNKIRLLWDTSKIVSIIRKLIIFLIGQAKTFGTTCIGLTMILITTILLLAGERIPKDNRISKFSLDFSHNSKCEGLGYNI